MLRFSIVVLFLLSNGFAKSNIIDYLSIGLANQKIDNKNFNSGKSLILNAGKQNLIKKMGLELEGSIPITKPKATINNKTEDLKFWSMGMYGTYLWNFDKITIKPRVGVLYENIKSAFNKSNTNPTTPTDKSKLTISGGIGISYKITNHTKLFTNYTKMEADIDHITFGAEFKF